VASSTRAPSPFPNTALTIVAVKDQGDGTVNVYWSAPADAGLDDYTRFTVGGAASDLDAAQVGPAVWNQDGDGAFPYPPLGQPWADLGGYAPGSAPSSGLVLPGP
jgi:hypothetical protein